MAFKLVFILFALTQMLHASYEEPWGKEAPLIFKKETAIQEKELAGFDTLISFHQQVLSNADGPRSHYIPSSSKYMLQACKKYGFFTGLCLGCDRLMRENSSQWVYPIYKTRDGDYLKRDPIP